MLIKHSRLTLEMKKPFPAIVFLLGQNRFQLNTLADIIKSTWCQASPDPVDKAIININTPADWLAVEQEANSYSLFSTTAFLDARYDKKTLGNDARAILERYLQQVNRQTLVLIRAPELPLKQLQGLVNNASVQVIFCTPPDRGTIIQWLNHQLNFINNDYDKQIPALIHQYTEGNLLASSQVIEKLRVLAELDKPLTLSDVHEQLINQCDHSLYDLAAACLMGDPVKAIQLLRQAASSKTEPTLILWLLTQEIRLLMQLIPARLQTQSFRDKASQLKIWSQRISLYQSAVKKFNEDCLVSLLHWCYQLDFQIKTSQNKQTWQSLEMIALSLCNGKQVGYHA